MYIRLVTDTGWLLFAIIIKNEILTNGFFERIKNIVLQVMETFAFCKWVVSSP